MIYKNLFFRALLVGMAGLIAGCDSFKVDDSNSLPTGTEGLVKVSSQTKNVAKSFLLIGLEPYLGKIKEDGRLPTDLLLESAGKPLRLKDSNGLIHSAVEIRLKWRTVPLNKPKKVVRQVSEPFASFESAERLALQLKNQGITAVVAHPKQWEVWVPEGVSLPKDKRFKKWEKTVNTEIRPFLKGSSGELLLVGPLEIDAPDGLKWNNGLYFGPFRLQADAYGTWTLIEKLSMDKYLEGVVPHEIGSGSPSEALAAQAVLARTWALANSHRFAVDGYHLCSDTQCQVYKNPEQASEAVKQAISITSGKFLSWKNKPIHAVYHASNGGVMASVNEAWSMQYLPYLKVKLDGSSKWTESFQLPLQTTFALESLLSQEEGAYGKDHSRFRWKRVITAEELKSQLHAFKAANKIPAQIKVEERGPSGRVLVLKILDEAAEVVAVLKLDQIRGTLRALPSTLFIVNQINKGVWQFSGGGFGHGAGLSQAGAIDLARRGWDFSSILLHYYPGTKYETLPDLPKAP